MNQHPVSSRHRNPRMLKARLNEPVPVRCIPMPKILLTDFLLDRGLLAHLIAPPRCQYVVSGCQNRRQPSEIVVRVRAWDIYNWHGNPPNSALYTHTPVSGSRARTLL